MGIEGQWNMRDEKKKTLEEKVTKDEMQGATLAIWRSTECSNI